MIKKNNFNNKKFHLIGLFFFMLSNSITAQVGINTDAPNASAVLDIVAKNSDKGLLIPRIPLTSTTDNTTIANPATSLMVYNTTSNANITPGFFFWDSTKWSKLSVEGSSSGSINAWNITGNAGTIAGTNFLGTTDNQDLVFKTNNAESGRISVYQFSTALGYQTTAPFKSVALGSSISSSNSGTESVSIGESSYAKYQSVAIGSQASTTNNQSIAIGKSSTASLQATALGSNTTASAINSTAIGYNTTAAQPNSIILGNGADVGIGTATPTAGLDVGKTFKLGSNGSTQKNIISFSATLGSTIISNGSSNNTISRALDVTFNIPTSNLPSTTRATVVVSPNFKLPGSVSIVSARLASTTQVEVRFLNPDGTNQRDIGGTYYITIIEF